MGQQYFLISSIMKVRALVLHGLVLSLASNGLVFADPNVREDDFQQIHLDIGVGDALCSGTESYDTVDPDDCHNFYECIYDEDADTFQVYKFQCQEGEAFDETSHSCQDEITVDRCWYTCPNGWDLFQNSCYFFSHRNCRPKTFTDALSACQQMDAYLVEIESK